MNIRRVAITCFISGSGALIATNCHAWDFQTRTQIQLQQQQLQAMQRLNNSVNAGNSTQFTYYGNPQFIGPNQAAHDQFYGRYHEWDNQ